MMKRLLFSSALPVVVLLLALGPAMAGFDLRIEAEVQGASWSASAAIEVNDEQPEQPRAGAGAAERAPREIREVEKPDKPPRWAILLRVAPRFAVSLVKSWVRDRIGDGESD